MSEPRRFKALPPGTQGAQNAIFVREDRACASDVEAVAHLLREWEGEESVADWNVNAGGCRDYYTRNAVALLARVFRSVEGAEDA